VLWLTSVSTFLHFAFVLENRLHFRGVYLDGNRPHNQFERKDYTKDALPPHKETFYALEQSSRDSYASPNCNIRMGLGAQLPIQPSAQSFELLVGERYRLATESNQVCYPRHLEHAQPVAKRHMDKDIPRKKRELKLHPAIFPSPYGTVQR
jgi:hypothetical protein